MAITKADKIKLGIILVGSLLIAIWDSSTWQQPVKAPIILLVPFAILLRVLFAGLIIYGIIRLFWKPKTERSFFGHTLHYGFYFALIYTAYLIIKKLFIFNTLF